MNSTSAQRYENVDPNNASRSNYLPMGGGFLVSQIIQDEGSNETTNPCYFKQSLGLVNMNMYFNVINNLNVL